CSNRIDNVEASPQARSKLTHVNRCGVQSVPSRTGHCEKSSVAGTHVSPPTTNFDTIPSLFELPCYGLKK
ncbi:MAG TPA: hypothetical protein VEI07_07975, partial [Planctomycetaceae bacterium]|nr:hypothetical protein [Planctomycetaceae bacterium]